MNKLNLLIKKLCPNGVEYKTIKETVGLNRGSRLVKNQLSDEFEYEVYHGSKDTILGKYNNFNAPANTTIVVNTGGIGGVKFINKPFWCSDGSFWLGHCNSINDKFLYYCLAGYEEYFASKKRVGGVPTIDRDVVESFKIPVPPLEVQEEIVRILDQFTLLTAELTAELTARKQQYQVYLNEIMNAESYEKFKLEEYAKIYDGTHSTPEYLNEGVKFISVENIKNIYSSNKYVSQEAFDSYKIKPKIGDVFMTRIGDVGTPAVMTKQEDLAYYVSLALIRPGNKLLPKFLYFYIKSTAFKKELNKYMLHTAVPIKINKGDIGKCKIIIPSLEEQQRIVDILDKFDTYCNDLTQGLPAEIELRKQQYEYYRDKLLSFKELK